MWARVGNDMMPLFLFDCRFLFNQEAGKHPVFQPTVVDCGVAEKSCQWKAQVVGESRSRV